MMIAIVFQPKNVLLLNTPQNGIVVIVALLLMGVKKKVVAMTTVYIMHHIAFGLVSLCQTN